MPKAEGDAHSDFRGIIRARLFFIKPGSFEILVSNHKSELQDSQKKVRGALRRINKLFIAMAKAPVAHTATTPPCSEGTRRTERNRSLAPIPGASLRNKKTVTACFMSDARQGYCSDIFVCSSRRTLATLSSLRSVIF